MPYDTIYPFIHTRLQDSIAGVDDSAFDGEIAAIILKLLAPYPGTTYDTLSGDDLSFMDAAVGRLASAALVTPYSTGGAARDLVKERTASGAERGFVPAGPTEKEVWIKEAKEYFALISFVSTAGVSVDLTMFAVIGRREVQEWPRNNFDLAFGDQDCD